MATSAAGVAISVTQDNPGSSDKSQHVSLVRSQDRRGYGTVRQLKRSSNGFLIHEVSECDTLQGIALKYAVPVSVCVCVKEGRVG